MARKDRSMRQRPGLGKFSQGGGMKRWFTEHFISHELPGRRENCKTWAEKETAHPPTSTLTMGSRDGIQCGDGWAVKLLGLGAMIRDEAIARFSQRLVSRKKNQRKIRGVFGSGICTNSFSFSVSATVWTFFISSLHVPKYLLCSTR